MRRSFELGSDVGRVYYVAPDGDAGAAGRTIAEPTSLESAIARVETGDAVILRGGIYRVGDLRLNQGITIQPYQAEHPILKGTRVAAGWEPVRAGMWRTKWETLFPAAPADWWQREREMDRTPLHKFNNDMVFVDGELLESVGRVDEVDNTRYWIDYGQGDVYIGRDPSGCLVEITAFDVALRRTTGWAHGKPPDRRGPTIRGITFTQYAARAIEMEGRDPEGVAAESTYGKEVVSSTFEHCEFTHCSRVAGYFRGDDLTIRHCLVSDTGTEGLFILNSNDVLIERNIVTRNNIEDITGYYVTAIKIFNQCNRVICRDNLVTDHFGESSGVWYDVGAADGVFVNNWIERTDNGFFFEISQRAICAGNVFVDCKTGIKILNSRDVHVHSNTLVNSRLHVNRTERSAQGDHFGWHPATGPGVGEREGHVIVGNLFVADESFQDPLVQFDQAKVLQSRLTAAQAGAMHHNVYVRRSVGGAHPIITCASARTGQSRYDTIDDFREQYPQFGDASRSYLGHDGPLFRGRELRRLELVSVFPAARLEVPLPAPVAKALGLRGDTLPHPGAVHAR